MKTIYGFGFLVITFCFIFVFIPFTKAEELKNFPYTFSITGQTGFLYGYSEEIVYKDSNSDVYLSELLWDIKPLFYAGFNLNFSRINPMEKLGFFADLSLKFGIPNETGTMVDRDWVSGNGLTNFSSHKNFTQGAFILDFSSGVSAPVFSRFVFSAYLSFSYMYFSWASYDGYIKYESNDWEEKDVYGPVINYIQKWFVLAPGMALSFPFFRIFSVGLAFQISPLIICMAEDQHFSRRIEFNDFTMGGMFLEPKGEFVFSPLPKLNFAFSVGYRYIADSRGDTYSRNTGLDVSGDFSRNIGTAGAGFRAFDIGLSVRIHF